MISNEIKQYIDQAIAANKKQELYSTKNTVNHRHNGIDSPKLSLASTEAGVSSIIAGTNVTISPSSGTGNVTVNSSATVGVSSVTASGAGISASPTTGAVVVENTGVTSIVAGANVTVSSATGAVTVSATGGGSGVTSSSTGFVSAQTNNVTTTISHSLGRTPVVLMLAAVYNGGADPGNSGFSWGSYDGTNHSVTGMSPTTGQSESNGSELAYIVNPSCTAVATVVSWSSTNFVLNWNITSGQQVAYNWTVM